MRYTAEVNEADVAAIPGIDASSLTPAERAVVRFATHFGNDHHAVTEAHFSELKQFFSDEQVTELLLWSAMALGLGRILKVAQLVDANCPLPSRDKVVRSETIATV